MSNTNINTSPAAVAQLVAEIDACCNRNYPCPCLTCIAGRTLAALAKERDELRDEVESERADADLHAQTAGKRLKEIEALKKRVEELEAYRRAYVNEATEDRNEAIALRAENARLRSALRVALPYVETHCYDLRTGRDIDEMRAALAGKDTHV
jgi:predicted RNase H-like nuclease (RuvC/YqgF family)